MILEYQPIACKAKSFKRNDEIWRNVFLTVPHCLPNRVELLHPVSHGPQMLFVQPCSLMLWLHTLCFLPPYFFSRWFPSENFFPYYRHPNQPQFSLIEILVFEVFSISLLQTSLLWISLYHYLTSVPVPFPLISITWHLVCIFPVGLTCYLPLRRVMCMWSSISAF